MGLQGHLLGCSWEAKLGRLPWYHVGCRHTLSSKRIGLNTWPLYFFRIHCSCAHHTLGWLAEFKVVHLSLYRNHVGRGIVAQYVYADLCFVTWRRFDSHQPTISLQPGWKRYCINNLRKFTDSFGYVPCSNLVLHLYVNEYYLSPLISFLCCMLWKVLLNRSWSNPRPGRRIAECFKYENINFIII